MQPSPPFRKNRTRGRRATSPIFTEGWGLLCKGWTVTCFSIFFFFSKLSQFYSQLSPLLQTFRFTVRAFLAYAKIRFVLWSEDRLAEKFYTMTRHYPDLGSRLVEPSFPSGATNQKHYPDLGSDTSSVWIFCARFSNLVSRGNRWWRREMSTVFSGWPFCSLSQNVFRWSRQSYGNSNDAIIWTLRVTTITEMEPFYMIDWSP